VTLPSSYTVVVEPDVPGEHPRYAFGRAGALIEEYDFEARWGTPLVIRIEPFFAPVWVGAFAAGGMGLIRDVFACPSPDHACVIVDGLAYVVDVRAPARGATIAAKAVTTVVPVPDAKILLLAGDTDLAAVGAHGFAWSTPRLVVDDLRVLRATPEAIVCTGDVGGRMGTITLSPETGAIWGSGA
jgi:hypothetical protein